MSWIVLGILLVGCGILLLTIGNILLWKWVKSKR